MMRMVVLMRLMRMRSISTSRVSIGVVVVPPRGHIVRRIGRLTARGDSGVGVVSLQLLLLLYLLAGRAAPSIAAVATLGPIIAL
jgi:hypothetical protein